MTSPDTAPAPQAAPAPSMDRPAIVVYGNCQAGFVSDVLQRLPSVTDRYEVVWIRNAPGIDGVFKPVEWSLVQRTAILLEQTGNFGNDGILRANGDLRIPFPATCRRIRFPPLFMTTLWPFVVPDPRNTATILAAHIEGAYPRFLGNRLILQLLAEERDPEVVFRRFMDIRIADVVDLDRLHKLTLSKLRALDRDADLPVAPIVEQGFTRERLFVMQLHPSGAMFAHLCRSVLDAVGVPIAGPRMERLIGAIARWPGIGNYDAPIHPQIVEHFGLEWARDLTYRYYEEGHFDFETSMRRYIDFTHIQEYRFAAEAERCGDLALAEAVLRHGIGLHPAQPYLHLRLGLLLERQNRLDEAIKPLMQAVRMRHSAALFHRHLARVLRRAGMLPMAYASAASAVALDGDSVEAADELVACLMALGRDDEAAAARAEAAELRACFGDPPLELERAV